MIVQIEKKKLQNKSEIALGLMLEEIASAGRKPNGMRHYLGETCSEGKKYVFKIEVEVMAAEKFKLGDRVNHKKYGVGTVSKNHNGMCYSYDGNVSIVFDSDIPIHNKRMSVPQENVSLIK